MNDGKLQDLLDRTHLNQSKVVYVTDLVIQYISWHNSVRMIELFPSATRRAASRRGVTVRIAEDVIILRIQR